MTFAALYTHKLQRLSYSVQAVHRSMTEQAVQFQQRVEGTYERGTSVHACIRACHACIRACAGATPIRCRSTGDRLDWWTVHRSCLPCLYLSRHTCICTHTRKHTYTAYIAHPHAPRAATLSTHHRNQHTHTRARTRTHTHSLTHTQTNIHTCTHIHAHTHTVSVSLFLSHTLSLFLTHTFTHSHTHTHTERHAHT